MKTTTIKPFLLSLAILSPAVQAATDFENYRIGKYNNAFASLNNQPDSAVANYYLGQMYLYGYGQLRNVDLAINYFTRSAEKGYLPAQLYLGRYYLQVKKQPDEALKYFKMAARQDDLDAIMYVTAAYMNGYGTKKDKGMARSYFIEAAKQGNAIAQYVLSEHFFESRASSNRRLGRIWLNKSAEEGKNPLAQYDLARLYWQGKEFRRDTSKAMELYQASAKQNYIPAMLALAAIAVENKDMQQAESWYKKAAENNNAPAMLALASLYLDEASALHDDKLGFLWMQKAAMEGNAEAAAQLATLFKTGRGTAADEKQAASWEQKAKTLAKNTEDENPRVAVARWLSNDKSDEINMPQYQMTGILSPWKNPKALQQQIYNQSPKMVTLSRSTFFKPDFRLVQPDSVPLNAYYDALISESRQLAEQDWRYPEYPLSKHLQAQLLASSSVINHDLNLPYDDFYSLDIQKQQPQDLFAMWFPENMDEQNYLALFNDMYSRAILGDAQAQFHIGQMFQYGLGVMKNNTMAITFYKKAAIQQHLPAQYAMALLYIKQNDDPEAYSQGVKWLRDAAFKGNAYAQYVMSKLLKDDSFNTSGVAKDNQQAESMLNLAAESGYGQAQYELAEALLRDKNAVQTVQKQESRRKLIRSLFKKAARQGVAEALLPLAFFDAMENDPKHQAKAFAVARQQAELGKPKAALLLALLYDRGIGVAEDHDKAIEWYQRSGDNLVRQFIMGTYYAEGKHIRKDLERGRILLRQSANSSFSYADLNLAILQQQAGESFLPELIRAYQNGNSHAGILLADYTLAQNQDPVQLEQAMMIYRGLAKKGDQQAQLKLGYMAENGIGMPVSMDQAIRWYEASAAQNNPLACFQAGLMYQTGALGQPDYRAALKWYGRAADSLPEAALAQGFVLETVYDRYQDALNAYKKAAKAGNPLGIYNMGLIFDYGKGHTMNEKMAEDLYQKAASQGVASAMTRLGDYDFNGLAAKQDTDEALSWYKKAADSGNPTALYMLGLFSESGIGEDLNYQQAFKYYQAAALKGNEKAMIAVARFYQYGIGMPKEPAQAEHWYQMLAKQNVAYGQYQLAQMYLQSADEKRIKLARPLLISAKQNGYQPAAKALDSLSAQSEKKLSFVESVEMNKVPLAAGESADRLYFNSLSEWNRGDEQMSRMMLKRIITQYPNFQPAKKVYQQINPQA